ncbi:MAG: hypothetical protein K5764_03440 [Prevotella sp.]|nr:hypothetical protein [Prevotella sp.]
MKKILISLMACTMLTSAALAAEPDTLGYDKFRFGGYGEMVANFKDYGINRFYGHKAGNAKQHHNTISIPRFVLAFDYKFTPKWILGAEIEFEHGGTGVTYELENTENGEYETEVEKGGEVALEQFHITRLIVPEFNIRAGHLIVPVGLTNEHHEPINFFGSSRPEGETTIIPCTWHETGIEFLGKFGKGYGTFDYEAMIVTGLNANGFDRNNWVRKGRQGVFEGDNFTCPAYVARLNYTGVPGLRLGASIYYCPNTGANADKLVTYDAIGKVPVTLYSFDAQYTDRYVTARANYLSGNVAHADQVGSINGKLSNKAGYSRLTPIAKKAVTYNAEIGLNLKNIIGADKNFPVIYPFAQYEYYNSQEEGTGMDVMDSRCQVSKWNFGLNWRALPNLVVKADYTTRQIGTSKVFGSGPYNSENEFGIGVAYIGWFFKK